jgi:hypothetical protein
MDFDLSVGCNRTNMPKLVSSAHFPKLFEVIITYENKKILVSVLSIFSII